jgi:hypothetical protein
LEKIDEKKIEVARMDSGSCSHVKSPWPQENTGSANRQNSEANRRRNTAKGFQFGIVVRIAGLRGRKALPH